MVLLFNNIKMKDDFFDWLDSCPVQWFLNGTEKGKSRTYVFIDNEDEETEE